MRITNIRIRKTEKTGKIKAIADIVLDEAICIHDIRVVDGPKGLFISFPYKKNQKGKLDLVHPIKTETREKIQNAILAEYKKIKD